MPTTEQVSARRRRRVRSGIVVGALVLFVGAGAWTFAELVPALTPAGCRVVGPDGASIRLEVEQAANAATIGGVAIERGLSDRAAVIGIATAIQESKLRNLDHGDRDSLGLFQQRPSQGWGTPKQVRDPVYASRAFFAALAQVPGYETRPLTEVAQEVQRSGYPEAYADHEEEAVLIARPVTGADPTALTCRLDPPATVSSPGALAADVDAVFGVRSSAEDSGIVVGTDTPRGAGAIAAWSVAHAARHGVTSVSVGERTWTRGRARAASEWAATPGDGSGPRRLVVRLGPPGAS